MNNRKDKKDIDDVKQMKSKLQFRKYNKINPKKEKKLHKFLDKFLGEFGEKSRITQPFYCDIGENIFIGKNCFLNYNCTILDMTKVNIGNNVLIAPNVVISAVTHPKSPKDRLKIRCYKKEVNIEDDVWIGANATIMPGVTIKKGAVVGAGAVVTKDVEPYTIVAGVPAKEIGKVD